MTTKQGIELRKITMENFRKIIRLEVADHQKKFVASNMYSLAEAKADGVSNPLAIYADGQMVGFTMYCFEPADETGYIDRLMVAAEHQAQGYGRAAMKEVIERLKNIPECQKIRTSFHPENSVADALYTSLGFEKTGELDEGEVVMVIELKK
jgi:diamine N-acetyltransferase